MQLKTSGHMANETQQSLKITFYKSTYDSNEVFRKVVTESQKRILPVSAPSFIKAKTSQHYIQFPPEDKVLANSVWRKLRQETSAVFRNWNS